MEKTNPHVVIIGAGFGGLNAVRALKNAPVRVTLIDRTNHHLFQPLLYQVAMAGLSPAEIAYPIRAIVRRQKNVNVVMDEVTGIDLTRRVVKIGEREMSYDYLVLAAGSQTNYFGHDDWMKNSVGLKDIDDSVEIRRRVLLAFEAAEKESDPELRMQMLTFVVIGGGPTGVELAGSLAELARTGLSRDFRMINPSSATILLLEAADKILAAFPEELSASAREQLVRLGVQVKTGAMVSNITTEGVELKGGEFIPSLTVLWCAGVSSSPLTRTLGVTVDRAGRVQVEPDLSIPGHPEAFAIGDLALFLHQDGKPLPGLAPVAMQQGLFVADAIKASIAGMPTKKFHYVHKGSLATIGRKAAVADFGTMRLTGMPAWLAWLLVHIFFLIGFRNRLVVMFDWIWSYFTYQRGARLITGRRLKPGVPENPCAEQEKKTG
jgi:NADH dehydrogenase